MSQGNNEIRRLTAENERLRELLAQKVVDSTMLTGLVPEDGALVAGFKGGACGLMAAAFGEQLFTSGAENYIEAMFTSSKYPDLGQITVTVKRETGKTPHQLRRDAEIERDQLAEQSASLLKLSENAAMRIKELDLMFGRYLLAMKAAVIDADQRGDEEGMRWIYNSLAGPGELPPEDEPSAQAYFDREIKAINDGLTEVFAYFDAQRKSAKAVPQ